MGPDQPEQEPEFCAQRLRDLWASEVLGIVYGGTVVLWFTYDTCVYARVLLCSLTIYFYLTTIRLSCYMPYVTSLQAP